MITPVSATIIMIVFVLIYGFILPLLEKCDKLKPVISFRWAVMVALMSVLIGCVLDFSHLTDEIRMYTIVGVTITCVLFIILRSIEKAMANGWSFGVKKIHVEKGTFKSDVECGGKADGNDENSN